MQPTPVPETPNPICGLRVPGPYSSPDKFVIGRIIRVGDTIRWTNAGRPNQGVIIKITKGEDQLVSSIITDSAVLGLDGVPLENIIGIGTADRIGPLQLMQPPLPQGPVSWGSNAAPKIEVLEPEKVCGVQLQHRGTQEKFVIGKQIVVGDTIRWMIAIDQPATAQGVITGFQWGGAQVLSSIITDHAVLGVTASADISIPRYPLENIIGIGTADHIGSIRVVQQPQPKVSWGSKGAPQPLQPLRPPKVSWGSKGAPLILEEKKPGGGRGKLRYRRRSRRSSFRRGRRAGKSYNLTTARRKMKRFTRK